MRKNLPNLPLARVKRRQPNQGFILASVLTTLIIALTIVAVIRPQHALFTRFILPLQTEILLGEIRALQYEQLLKKRPELVDREGPLSEDNRSSDYFIDLENYTLLPFVTWGFPETGLGPPSRENKKITTAITYPHKKINATNLGQLSAGTLYLTTHNRTEFRAISTSPREFSGPREYCFTHNHWSPIASSP